MNNKEETQPIELMNNMFIEDIINGLRELC